LIYQNTYPYRKLVPDGCLHLSNFTHYRALQGHTVIFQAIFESGKPEEYGLTAYARDSETETCIRRWL